MNGNPGAKELRVMGHTELKQNIHNKYILHEMYDTNFKIVKLIGCLIKSV